MNGGRKIKLVFGVVVGLAMTLVSCTPKPNGWTEEVELANGETIEVMRHETYRSNTELSGRKNVWVERAELTIKDARAGVVPTQLTASEYLVHLGFDAAKRQWYVIGAVEDCRQAKRDGLGSRPYYEYTFSNGAWLRQPVSQEHVGVSSNLLISKELAESGRPVKLDEKKRADVSVSLPDYLKRVLDSVPC